MSTAAPNARSTSRHRSTRSARRGVRQRRAARLVAGRELDDASAIALSTTIVSGRHEPRHHRLAEARRRVHEDLVVAAGDRVAGEDDRGGERRDERLDDDRHRAAVERQAAPRPIADRPVAPERRPAAEDGGRDLVGGEVELGVVEARRTRPRRRPRPRRTSGRRGGADAPGRRASSLARRSSGSARPDATAAPGGPASIASTRVVRVASVGEDARVGRQPIAAGQRRDLCREGIGREAEPGRDPEAEARQPVERGRLAADPRDVRAATIEPLDQGVRRLERGRASGESSKAAPGAGSTSVALHQSCNRSRAGLQAVRRGSVVSWLSHHALWEDRGRILLAASSPSERCVTRNVQAIDRPAVHGTARSRRTRAWPCCSAAAPSRCFASGADRCAGRRAPASAE